MLKQIIIFLLLTTNYLLLATYSSALELRSSRINIEVEKADIDGAVKNPSDYTIQSLETAQAFKKFITTGYFISTKNPSKVFSISLSPSLLSLSDISTAQSNKSDLTFSITLSDRLEHSLYLIQEYPLKNLAGDTIDLSYSLSSESRTRSLPNQNKGNLPTIILTKPSTKPIQISFNLNPPPTQPVGTYETIIDFVAIPSY